MNEIQAKDEIRLIQEMIERTKKITAGSWMFFLVWGIVIILSIACIATPTRSVHIRVPPGGTARLIYWK